MGQLKFVLPAEGICHVKSPAVNAVGRLQPFFQNRIFPAVDHVPQRLRGIVEGGQGIDTQPFVIGIVGRKEIVFPLWAVRVVVGSDGLIEEGAVPIEPLVGDAGVVDGDIQNQLHAILVKRLAQLRQRLITAQMGIHMEVVQAVVLMYRGRHKNGV